MTKYRTTCAAVAAAAATVSVGLLTATAASAAGGSGAVAAGTTTASAPASASAGSGSTGSPQGAATAGPSASGSGSTGPTSPTDCPTLDDDSLDISMPTVPAKGTFPQELTAGGGWKSFTVRVANRGAAPIRDVSPVITAYSLQAQHDLDLLQLEYLDAHTWRHVPNEEHSTPSGSPFARLELAPGAVDTLTLRIRATRGTPAGGGFAMVGGYWNNGDGTCGDTDGDQAEFQVRAAAGGGQGGSTGPAGGTPGNSPSAQSGGGGLADTGAPAGTSALALGGAGAVTLGAVALVVTRRRRAGTHS